MRGRAVAALALLVLLGGCFFGDEAKPQAEKPFDKYQPRAVEKGKEPAQEGNPSEEPEHPAAEQPPAEEEHPLANAAPPAMGQAEPSIPPAEAPAAPQEAPSGEPPEQPAPFALPGKEPPPISAAPPTSPPPFGEPSEESPPPAQTFNPPANKPTFGKVPFGHGEDGESMRQPAEPDIDNLFDDGGPELPAATPLVDAGVAMRNFFALLREGENAEAYRFILMPSKPAKRELVRNQVAQMGERLTDGSMKIETLLTRRQGKWALVVVHITMHRGGKTGERVSNQFMYDLKGQWKLIPATIRDDPAIAPLLNQDFQTLKNWYQSNKPALEKQYIGK